MNLLEKWHADGVIQLEMSETSFFEARAGNNQVRKGKAANYIFSQTYADTLEEKALLDRIALILFPHGVKSSADANDVEIVFNARKYHRILITNEGNSRQQPGGILGNAQRLRDEIGVTVVNDAEAVAMVRRAIQERDLMAQYAAKQGDIELPEWLGKD